MRRSVPDPEPVVAHHGAWKQHFIGANQTRREYPFLMTVRTLFERNNFDEDGQSAANTKLDPDSAAYKALVEKHSYTGPATVSGRDYQANYAPLMSKDGQLTGALVVGIPK